MFGWWLLTPALVAGGGCSCQPPLPPGDKDTEPPPPTGETATEETADSAPPEGPCPQEEVEPNDEDVLATPIVLEQRACGVVAEPSDSDWYTFVHEEEGWLEVAAEAGSGSIADVSILLFGDGWNAARADDPGNLDAHLLFPAPAGEIDLLLSEQRTLGGERYGYTVLVSEAKAPTEWDDRESEPNDTDALAGPLAIGGRVFGTLDGNGALPDFDWYELPIPPGSHRLRLQVTAYDVGSSANLTLRLYDPALESLPDGCKDPCPPGQVGCVECPIEGGVTAEQRDPDGTYVSRGSEVIYVQVQEAGGREGPAYWYVLSVTEAP